ncbi:MAG: helix-turn-helix transcriptional regulator [Luteolibacter sp.]
MERLGHTDYARLLDFLAGLHEAVPLAEFGKHLIRLTSELLPGLTVSFDQIEESSGFYSLEHNFPLSDSERDRVFSRLREVYQQNPIYHYIQSGGRGPVVDIASLMPRRKFQRTDFYQDIFRPVGLEYQAQVLMNRPGWIHTLTVNRDRPIPQSSSLILALAARHIQIAHRNACLMEKLRPLVVANVSPDIPFTRREREVFAWLQEGKRNAEIAVLLGCSPRTVDKHVQRILFKTGAETRTAAARWRP